MSQMPALNPEAAGLSDEERALFDQVVGSDGCLRASKPKKADGDAKYLWRMLVFGLSPNEKHQCLPVMAEFDLDGSFAERQERAKVLDALARRLEVTVPVAERHGTLKWGRALGVL